MWSGGAIFGVPEDKIDVEAYVAAAVAAGEDPAQRLPTPRVLWDAEQVTSGDARAPAARGGRRRDLHRLLHVSKATAPHLEDLLAHGHQVTLTSRCPVRRGCVSANAKSNHWKISRT